MEIRLENVTYFKAISANKEMKYLENISFVLKEGTVFAVSGDYAELFSKLIALFIRPSKGKVFFGDVGISRTAHIKNINFLRQKVGCVLRQSLFEKDTVEEELQVVALNYGIKSDSLKLQQVLKMVLLSTDYLNQNPKELSFTEQKKVSLAKVLLCNAEIIILEHFDDGLSYKEMDYFKKLFKKLNQKYHKTFLVVTNRVDFMMDFVSEIVILKQGNIVYSSSKINYYDEEMYQYLDMPKIVECIMHWNQLGHAFLPYTDLKELLKAVYRDVA